MVRHFFTRIVLGAALVVALVAPCAPEAAASPPPEGKPPERTAFAELLLPARWSVGGLLARWLAWDDPPARGKSTGSAGTASGEASDPEDGAPPSSQGGSMIDPDG